MPRYASVLICASLCCATAPAAGERDAQTLPADKVGSPCPAGHSATTAACLSPWGAPKFDVGDTIATKVVLRAYFPGMDLMRVKGDLGYYRTDEYVYLVDRTTGGILEVIRIADVILR